MTKTKRAGTMTGAMMIAAMLLLSAGGAYAQGRTETALNTYQEIRPFMRIGYQREFNQNALRERDESGAGYGYGQGRDRVIFLGVQPISDLSMFNVRPDNAGGYVADSLILSVVPFADSYFEWGTDISRNAANRAIRVTGTDGKIYSFVLTHNAQNGGLDVTGARIAFPQDARPKKRLLLMGGTGGDQGTAMMSTLTNSRRYGYGIYVMDGYEFREADGYDLIIRRENADLNRWDISTSYYMRIYEVNPNTPEREQTYDHTPPRYNFDVSPHFTHAHYHRVTVGNKTLEIELYHYFTDSERGGGALWAMVNTIHPSR